MDNMSFTETPRFPDKISYGSSGGPSFSTDIITVKSGFEARNVNWVQSRHSYDVAFGVATSQERLSELIEFFQAMYGKAYTFRYKDWGDYKSCRIDETVSSSDQLIGAGDSTDGIDGTTEYQLVKNYIAGNTTIRDIKKPVSVIIEVDGVLKVENTDYTIDMTTGIITFLTTKIPLIGEEIKSGYEFDVPCRFDTDELNINIDAYAVGTASVPLIEVRL